MTVNLQPLAFSFWAEAENIRLRDYFALLKPRVVSLVVFTGFVGMWLAPGLTDMHPFLIVMATLALALGAGAAGTINMWYDRDIDALMSRTRTRPVPSGRISPDEALAFGILLSVVAVVLMALAANAKAAALLAFANFFYAVIYTMILKRRTPQNIVIGGAAGAFPPMIGWLAVSGEISAMPVILFLLIFFWTPPHFWALALYASSDYARAGVPMMPVVSGETATKLQMLAYTVILLPLALAPWVLGFAGGAYAVAAGVLGTGFVVSALRVVQATGHRAARAMFGYSVFYLFGVFVALMTLA